MNNNLDKLNTHDPHNEHVWADTTPTWVMILKVLGVIAGAFGLFVAFSLFTIVIFQLGG